jgi:quinol-cytochrome oxidoreductase complex cytochrome b subunit
MNGMYASALIALSFVILGLIIVHFSSDEPRRRD